MWIGGLDDDCEKWNPRVEERLQDLKYSRQKSVEIVAPIWHGKVEKKS